MKTSILATVAAMVMWAGTASGQGAPAEKPLVELRLAGQSVVLYDLDDEEGTPFGVNSAEDLELGVQRLSALGTVSRQRATLKVHLMATPLTTGYRSPDLADLHLTYKVDPALQVKLGRFKKTFTSIYSPFWYDWTFFDLSRDFKYVMGNLGLAGRDQGLMLFGAFDEGKMRWMMGAFDGQEEAKPWKKEGKTLSRANDSLQYMGRFEMDIDSWMKVGAGATLLQGTTLTVLKPDGTAQTEDDIDLLAYASSLQLRFASFTLEAEYIGSHVGGENEADGGGFHTDLSYDLVLGDLTLRPAVRYAHHTPNFDEDDTYTEAYTGALNVFPDPGIHFGLELGTLLEQPADVRSTQLLFQVAMSL